MLLASRLAYAEFLARRDTPEALQRAAAIDGPAAPAAYFERLAELDPAHESAWLDAALRLNPRSSQDWITTGLAAERSGDLTEAESKLLKAAAIDRQYLPAWTLANFYFRHRRGTEFWTWARRAAELTYDDYRPLLLLAHELEPNVATALTQLGADLPLLRADLDYLVQRDRLDDAQQAARLLLARKTKIDTPRLTAFADVQVRAGRAHDALEIWNAVEPLLDPGRNAAANGDLTRSSSGLAFDWRLDRAAGVSSSLEAGSLTFRLSGQQPEWCVLLEQFVPIDPSRRYRLSFEDLTSGFSGPLGLLWDLDGVPAPISEAPERRTAEITFAPRSLIHSGLRIGKLRLLYHRGPGALRARGQLQLHHYRLEAL